MSTTPITHLYRSLCREIRLASKNPRSRRSLTVESGIRELVEGSKSEDATRQLITETRDFMRASRLHAGLLKRYTPLADMTEQEKVHAAARKVGLNTPIKYKAPEEA